MPKIAEHILRYSAVLLIAVHIVLTADCSPASAEASRSLSLAECFEKADANNKEIIAARYNLPVLKAGIEIAGALPNPVFGMEYGFGPAFTIIIAGNPQQFGFLERIQTAGKRSKQIELARANYRAAELQLATVRFDVHNRVRRTYCALAAAEAYVDLIEAQRKVGLELLDVAKKRFQAGKAAQSEVLQAELGIIQFDTQRHRARTSLQQATAALSLLIGETPERVEVVDVQDNGIFQLSATKNVLVPSPDSSLPALDKLLPTAYKERPDLKLAIQQKFADKKALNLARAQAIPDVFVDSGFQFTTFRPNQPYGLFSPPDPTKTTPTIYGCYLNIGAEQPIFYQHQGEIKQARATWLQDSDQIKQLQWQIAADIVTAYESAQVARANIFKFQNELIPQAALVARQARIRYQIGKTDISTAILARQQYQQVLSSYFDAVVAYQNAWADLEKAMGVPIRL